MNKLQQALEVVEHYFQATYRADSEVLFSLFHQQAAVSGFINSEFQSWVAKDFINNICSRPVAADNNQDYDKHVLAVELNGDIAFIKARNLVGDIYFTDQINLIWSDNRWLIISKIFASC